MSDFGTLISIFRNDCKDITTEEVSKIESYIQVVKSKQKYQDSMGEELSFKSVESEESNGGKGINILLSEYWGGEESEDEMMDYTESDKEQAQKISDLFLQYLGSEYKIEIYAGSW